MAQSDNIVVVTVPLPGFTVGAIQADGTHLIITSTSFFPSNLPRENYALFIRVSYATDPTSVVAQIVSNPATDNTFTIDLPKDGVYQIRLVGFLAEAIPSTAARATGTIIYDSTKATLVKLVDTGSARYFIPISLQDVPLSSIYVSSTPLNYLQVQPGKDTALELLDKILTLRMNGKKQLNREKIKDITEELDAFDQAIRGAENEFKLNRYVEAQRLLTLLDKLRVDSCTC